MSDFLPSTMQDFPLTLRMVLDHGRRVHGRSEVATFDGMAVRRARFSEVADRVDRLASALRRLGIRPGDRVATLCWNTQEHLEMYLAVPGMGAVVHTLNLRLAPDQLAWIVRHAEDRLVFVDDTLVPLLARMRPQVPGVEHVVVTGGGEAAGLPDALRYEDLLASEQPGYPWPEIDERAGAALCYTTGTTGNPKGVLYSHRSLVLHMFGVGTAEVAALSEQDYALAVVPMFHAMAWGLPYACWVGGVSMLMPGRFLQAAPLARLIEAERPTYACAVPTIWSDLLRWAEEHGSDLSSLPRVGLGGAAAPRALIERAQERFGMRIIQGWGMTETSPVAAFSAPPRGVPPERDLDWRARTGRVIFGVELRVVDDAGAELPWDGHSVGEYEVRGPWVTGSYYRDPAPHLFHDGWLRTGDVGTVDADGYMQMTDRRKDVIKSGGEWISSVALETALVGHPDVVEAAVIGVPDERWDERPLACVVLRPGRDPDPSSLRRHLEPQVAHFWLPERWAFLPEIPKTSVGKFDKQALRARYAGGELEVQRVQDPARRQSGAEG